MLLRREGAEVQLFDFSLLGYGSKGYYLIWNMSLLDTIFNINVRGGV